MKLVVDMKEMLILHQVTRIQGHQSVSLTFLFHLSNIHISLTDAKKSGNLN